MFRELLSRDSRFPPLLGTGLAAVLMGAVAVASAHASLPSRAERAARMAPTVAASPPAVRSHLNPPKFAFASPLSDFAVNSPFGLRKMPWEEGGRLHEGVDIAAPGGTPIHVTLAGTVVRTGVDGGYGRFVEVAHGDGLTSLYTHLGRAAPGLRAGMVIPAGYVVAYVGSTGRSTGAHLHFEIRENGRPLNPAAFMGRTFATTADLPLREAGRVPRRVRIAQVSDWPAGVATPASKRQAVMVLPAAAGGQVRATIMPVDAGTDASPRKPATPMSPAAAASARDVSIDPITTG